MFTRTRNENLKRKLAEQPLLVTSWRCRFGWHTWEQWQRSSKSWTGSEYQEQFCAHCNIKRMRKMNTYD